MGNAPLPSPPRLTTTPVGSNTNNNNKKIVLWSISTKSKIFGTRLHVVSVDESGGRNNSGTADSSSAAAAATATGGDGSGNCGGGGGSDSNNNLLQQPQQQNHEQQQQEQEQPKLQQQQQQQKDLVEATTTITTTQVVQDERIIDDKDGKDDVNGVNDDGDGDDDYWWKNKMPSLLRDNTDLPFQEYSSKIQQFLVLLEEWKGGVARLIILVWAFVIILGFICAYFIPGFWQSVIFSTPIYLPIIVFVVFTPLAVCGRRERIHNRQLVKKTNELFDDWLLRYKIHVKFYRVANLPGGTYIMTRNGLRRQKQRSIGGRGGDRSGNFCYVLVMTVVTEEEALAMLTDDATVGMISVNGNGNGNGDRLSGDGGGSGHDDDNDSLDSNI